MKTRAFIVAAALLAVSGLASADWPGFMGPGGLGVASGEKVKKDWSTPPKQLWKVQMGPGFASPAVVGGKVYVLDRNGNEEKFRVLDLKTGDEDWSQTYTAPPFGGGYGQTRGTPCVDGDMAYSIGVSGSMNAWDLKAKKSTWSKSLTKDFGAAAGGWGFAMSPVVLRDMVIVDTAGSGTSGVVALNKKTGEQIWKSPSFGGGGRRGGGAGQDSYTTPVVATLCGIEQIVAWHKGTVVGLDTKDGKILWKYDWSTDRPIPNPVVLPDDKIYLTIGYGGGSSMIKIEKGADGFAVKTLFQGNKDSASKVPPAIFHNGFVYTSGNDVRKGLQCLDTDGKVKWTGPSFGLGSMIIADGVIFVLNGDNGSLSMVAASPDGYKELGSVKLLGGKDVWAPLAIADGKLVIRDQSQMICLDVGAP